MNSKLRLFLDFGPLLAFFIAYRFFGVFTATATMIVCTIFSLSVTYYKEKTISAMPLISGVLVTVMGGITIYLHDDYFIKIKPTIVNSIFGLLLLGGLAFKQPLFKYVLGHALELTEQGWRILSLRWGLFFLFLAVLNEYIWRNYSLDFWVDFKVFGMLTLTVVFTACQIPLMKRYWVEKELEK